jgi:hypothetical protein
MPYDVGPGGTVTFNFNVTAPSTGGSYNFQWRMVQDGVEWFGASSTNAVVQVGCTPTTSCAAQGHNCGQVWNGCAYETCGSYGGGCASGQSCNGSTCVGATPQITGLVNNVNGASSSGFVNNYIQIWGNNFCSSGLQVYLTGYGNTYAYQVATNQINAYIYSGTALGGQYAYVNCNGNWSNAWYFTVANQQTSVCGNGSCEAGENGSNCGADCCDYYTSCNQSYRNQGQSYCRSFNGGGYYWYTPQTCGYNWGYGTQSSCGYGTTFYCCSSINNWTTSYCSY